MLPAKQHNDFVAEFRKTIDLLGTKFTLKPKVGADSTITGHFIDMGANDVPLINAIGVEARLVRTHATPVIKKFDVIVAPSGDKYTVHVCHEVYINDTLVCQKLVVKR